MHTLGYHREKRPEYVITEAIVYTISGSLILHKMRAGLICFLLLIWHVLYLLVISLNMKFLLHETV